MKKILNKIRTNESKNKFSQICQIMDCELKFIIIIKMYANSVKDNTVDVPCMFDFNYKFENLM